MWMVWHLYGHQVDGTDLFKRIISVRPASTLPTRLYRGARGEVDPADADIGGPRTMVWNMRLKACVRARMALERAPRRIRITSTARNWTCSSRCRLPARHRPGDLLGA